MVHLYKLYNSYIYIRYIIGSLFLIFFLDFDIIDARYPYEYLGGHIRSGKNLYTPESISSYFYDDQENQIPSNQRRVIIFHCEFSSERGPSMLRHLRQIDRQKNRYPKLDYPELYLLENGYKVTHWKSKFRHLTKNSIFGRNFDVCRKFRFLVKMSVFDCNFDFWGKFRFLTKIYFLFAKILIFHENFDFWRKLRFLAEIPILDENFDFWRQFRFFYEDFDFWGKFRCLAKISSFVENVYFWPQFQFLAKLSILTNNIFFAIFSTIISSLFT